MRVFVGWFLFLTAIGAVMIGGFVFPLILGYACFRGGQEFVQMARVKGYKPSANIVGGMIIAFFTLTALPHLSFLDLDLPPDFAINHFPILFTFGICISFVRLLLRSEKPRATIADIASTIMGFIYVGWMPAHLVLLRDLSPLEVEHMANPLLQPGLAYLCLSFFVIFGTDVAAYYCGKNFGKHKLYPEVSPKKTVEGAIGGLVASIFLATLVVYAADNYIFPSPPFLSRMVHAPLLGLVVSLAAQLGDLCESLMKRDAGIKDSSDAIPGHGGFLDRGDSMLFAGPIAYYWIKLVVLGIL